MTREEAINKLHGLIYGVVDRRRIDDTCRDVIYYLKEQEPRVMTLDEAKTSVAVGPFIIFEVKDSTGTELDFGVLVDDYYEMSEGSVLTVENFELMADAYCKQFRIWTSRPTEELMEATPWN